MKTFLVGGSVRDKLMGHESRDEDYLVLETTPEELKRQGFREVGESFSVFLHPKTKEEYALPRGRSLEEDLSHRDLTINAMAMDMDGNLIDPFGGARDLRQKILRHVSSFFSDDLLRVYRLMRFKAMYPDFTIAPETLEYVRELVKLNGFKGIHPERVLIELRKALMSSRPSLFFQGLKEVDGMSALFLELEHLTQSEWMRTMEELDQSVDISPDPLIRYSFLALHLGESIGNLGKRLSVPNDWLEASLVVALFHEKVRDLSTLEALPIVEMFYAMDAFRRPHLVEVLSLVCRGPLLKSYFAVVKDISSKEVSPDKKGQEIGEAIKEARVRGLRRFKGEIGHT